MSREERRQYQRQVKSMEKGAGLPPAARARAERNAARRAARRPQRSTPPGALDTRFWLRTAIIAVGLGFVAFSVQWGEGMPRALYAGLAVTVVTLVIVIGFRFLQRRVASRS